MACRSGCPTQDHATYGECLRSARIKTTMAFGGMKHTDSELAEYRALRAQGIQPAGTTRPALDAAKAISDKYGGAFDATNGTVDGKTPHGKELL